MKKKSIVLSLVLALICSACGTTKVPFKGNQEESWAVIQEYGFQNEYSTLSYTLKGETLKDCGDYYSMEATFSKPVKVPGNLQVGDTCEFVENDLTGEKVWVTYSEEGYLTDEDGREYYYHSSEDGSDVELYHGSVDRLDSPFYEGVLYIRKDAVTGAAITGQPYVTITTDVLTSEYGNWYNGLAFDENGMVTQLIFFGD